MRWIVESALALASFGIERSALNWPVVFDEIAKVHLDVPAGTLALVRSPRRSDAQRSKRASHIDPPASPHAIMRRACRSLRAAFRAAAFDAPVIPVLQERGGLG